MTTLNDFSNVCHEASLRGGWWTEYFDMPEQYRPYWLATKIGLVHSEVSEAFEGLRKGKKDDHLTHRSALEVELADALIRIFDLAGAMELDLQGAVLEKMQYNARRADHKAENRAAEGGKKF